MSNTLVTGSDLIDFQGAPFLDQWIDIAAAEVRAQAGWHIAPQVTETISVESYGGRELVIPSKRVVSVASVGTLSGWELRDGVVYRSVGWPTGLHLITLTHGYAACPPDLLPVVVKAIRAAQVTDRNDVKTSTEGPYSVTYRDVVTSDPVVNRYSVKVGVT